MEIAVEPMKDNEVTQDDGEVNKVVEEEKALDDGPKENEKPAEDTASKSSSTAEAIKEEDGSFADVILAPNRGMKFQRLNSGEQSGQRKISQEQQHLSRYSYYQPLHMSSPPQQPMARAGAGGNLRTFNANGSNNANKAAMMPLSNSSNNPTIQPARGRMDRPRPLKFSSSVNLDHDTSSYGEEAFAPISIDGVLGLMFAINQAVKNNQFTAQLAAQIFQLHRLLKQVGDILETNYKEDLNRCFISLRQACCRDSGQLGTPCRIKIMELIELRALGWRPNLSHSQYYVNRTNVVNNNSNNNSSDSNENFSELGPVPISAPPYGTMPMNPFAFHSMGGGAPTAAQEFVSASPTNNGNAHHHNGMPPTQYFLIPATATPQGGFAFVAPTPTAMGGPPPPLGMPPQGMGSHPPLSISPSAPVGSSVSPVATVWPKGAVMKPSGKYQHPVKVPGKTQFKDEVIIRNADSGKIMGIKGRRVAIIEEISKTIISFQKVAPGTKERCLTITGPTEESIEQARTLIENTIRRNASPDREHGEGDLKNSMSSSSGDGGLDDAEADEEGNYVRYTISTGDAGELILSGMHGIDPKLMQQARGVLQDFFEQNQAVRTRTKTDASELARGERLERRRSMPPIQLGAQLAAHKSASRVTSLNDGESGGSNESPEQLLNQAEGFRASHYKHKAISTPNLAQTTNDHGHISSGKVHVESSIAETESEYADQSGEKDENKAVSEVKREEFMAEQSGGGRLIVDSTKSKLSMRVVYTRDFLLQCAPSPFCQLQPSQMQTMSSEMPEILRKIPGKFDPTEYKIFCQKLKTIQQRTS